MNTFTKTSKGPRALTLAAAAAGALLASSGASASSALEMVVYEDTVQGKRLVNGQWERVLKDVETRAGARFGDQTNLCVSLTLAGRFDDAAVACDDALAVAEKTASRPSIDDLLEAELDKRRAMAHTNRGVLRALEGDRAGARSDFEAAIELSPRVKAAAANLDLITVEKTIALAR